ncbi:hypothetical protein [Pseudonocardia asaccharolytica]|uniref:DUF8083 domain-containing protein n=1 Tax=Pseudonocardia asaccharolytica DSM 44247 = NBRC 16224 TaxID=1123024 RepID=A0A511D3N5_9PSEU|nr:hypothetical protein [Pseudonocardia asaccharolytica]GEL18214.1 hypothetical protein PA7_20510 [Pseudonocardia asaccharolytica DSM 44247 = NBRC 16224]
MLAPFLSYLRVYEPMRAFEGPSGAPIRAGLARGAIAPERAGWRERELCLRALVGSRLLPGDPTTDRGADVFVVTEPSGEQLICPFDTRPRAAAAVLGFLDSEEPLLRASALPVSETVARRCATAAMAELGDGAAHVVTAAWIVPLPWFAMVDPEQRVLRLDRPRRVWWRVPIGTARARAIRAEKILRDALGDTGPAEVLAETERWLERFDRSSVLELDYGGLVELINDEALRADESAQLVRCGLQALRDGDEETAGDCYDRLQEFWGAVAGKQRAG